MAKKCKKYEDGGLTFADMSDEDRAAQAKARIAEMGGPMPETPKAPRVAPAKPVPKGDIGENLRDMDMAGVDTGYDATEKARMAKQTASRHFAGRPGASAEPQVVTPKGGATSYDASESKRNLSRAGSRHASGPAEREIKPARKGAVRDLVDTFRNAPKLMKKGGAVGASKRADGIAIRGKTKGRVI